MTKTDDDYEKSMGVGEIDKGKSKIFLIYMNIAVCFVNKFD